REAGVAAHVRAATRDTRRGGDRGGVASGRGVARPPLPLPRSERARTRRRAMARGRLPPRAPRLPARPAPPRERAGPLSASVLRGPDPGPGGRPLGRGE